MIRGHERRSTTSSRSLLRAIAGTAIAVSASSGCFETPAADARTVKIGQSGETTYVAISEPSNVKENPECVRYCDRLADCWYAVTTGSVALTHDEVRNRCRSEEDDCRTKTKASHCCGRLTDCLEFSACHARSNNDEPAACSGDGKS